MDGFSAILRILGAFEANQRMLSVTVGVLRFQFLFYCYEDPLE